MLKAYLVSFLRNLFRNKTTSLISILGLSIGLASCFIIMLFVLGELNMDHFQLNRKTIYRVLREDKSHYVSSQTSFLLGPTLRQEFPEVQNFARFISVGTIKVKKDNQYVEESNFHFADQSIFDLLTFRFVEGKADGAIANPNSVVISEGMARKYFGAKGAVGNSLMVSIKGQEQALMVTGVFANLPQNSSLDIDFLGNSLFGQKSLMRMLIYYGTGDNDEAKEKPASWDDNFYVTLLQISGKADMPSLERKINSVIRKYQGSENEFNYSLQRYNRIYLHSTLRDSAWKMGKLSDIYVFSATAFLILLIACFNYVILALAQSERRAKEIGVRKVGGAAFRSLAAQVITESVAISIISLPLAIGITELLLPLVNTLLDRSLVINYVQNGFFVGGILLITLVISLISGFYISVYLNKFNPVEILRGSSVRSGVRSVFLKSLVVAQMAIFIALIIASLAILRQLRFVADYNPGLDPRNVLYISMNDATAQRNYRIFREELEKLPEISSVSAATNNPPSRFTMNMTLPRVDDPSKQAKMEVMMVDFNYIETLGLTMKEGRSFSADFPGDSGAVVLNESGVKELGLADPVGKKLPMGTVIGVVKDFPIHDLHSKIPGAYFTINSQNLFEIAVKTKGNVLQAKPLIEAVWRKVNPDIRFDGTFFSTKIEQQYTAEHRLSKIIVMFTLIAVIIASLGLFGLSTFITLIRTKEIGIRKVNGGTLVQMVLLFWKELIGWTFLAFIAATPVAWYMMHRWLQNFAYQARLSWWIFALAGVFALLIALVTVSWQACRAARRNPVEALRYE